MGKQWVFVVVGLMQGCGSIISTAKQDFTVQSSRMDLAHVTQCTLKNQSGMWMTPPGQTLHIDRDRHDMHVACVAPNDAGEATVPFHPTVWPFFVNILAWGIFAPIGWSVDFANDADCAYPDSVTIAMAPKTGAVLPPATKQIAPAAPVRGK
jgi:uncharacterized protein YceK